MRINERVGDYEVVDLLKYLLSEECQLRQSKLSITAPKLKNSFTIRRSWRTRISKTPCFRSRGEDRCPWFHRCVAVWDAMRTSYQAVMGGAEP